VSGPQIVILAGGLGTRLRPWTLERPKAMVEVGGRPFLERQIRLVRSQGFRRFLVLGGYRMDQIRRHFRSGERWGVSIKYRDDGEGLVGTAGALWQAVEELDPWFLLLDGDSFLPIDFRGPVREFLARGLAGPGALMTVYRNRNRWSASNVEVAGGRVVRYERGGRGLEDVHYGLSVVARRVVEGIGQAPGGRRVSLSLDAVWARLAGAGELGAYRVRRRFYQIGDPAGLEDLEGYLRRSGLAT